MFVRYAYYYAQLERLLVELEDLVKPEEPLQHLAPNSPGLVGISEVLKERKKERWTKLKTVIAQHMELLDKESNELRLKRTGDRLRRIREYVDSVVNIPSEDDRIVYEIRILREALQDDLQEYRIFIPSLEQAQFHQRPKLFGEKVYDAFPSARQDIVEAGNCYATDNFTACIFHLMRVAERGMRVLAKDLKIKKIGKTPLEYSEWGTVCKALSAKVSVLQQRKRGPKKSAILKRYADAASQADYINEIWRKDVSHTRQQYNAPEALSVLMRVREFMQSLAEWLHEPDEWSNSLLFYHKQFTDMTAAQQRTVAQWETGNTPQRGATELAKGKRK